LNAKNFYKVILVGGGHSNIQVIKAWAMNAPTNAKLILISSNAYAPYSGMLPLYLMGKYTFDQIHFDLRRICSLANVEFIESEVTAIDRFKKLVKLKNRPNVSFDIISINVGITPAQTFQFNADSLGITLFSLKPISKLIKSFEYFLTIVKTWPDDKVINVSMIGGGAAGVEVALAIDIRLKKMNKLHQLTLFQRSEKLIHNHSKKASLLLYDKLQIAGIEVKLQTEISHFDNNVLFDTKGRTYTADFTFFSTDAKAPRWFEKSGLPICEKGFLKVNKYLHLEDDPHFYSAGDCIKFSEFDLPKAGVYAVRQGPVLKNNILYNLGYKNKKIIYKPQKTILGLIHCGENETIYSKGQIVASGKRFFKLKDYIDNKFMKNFSVPFFLYHQKNMKGMKGMKGMREIDYLRPDEINTCGGCGSKVSPDILYGILHSEEFKQFENVLPAILDDAPSFESPSGEISSSIDGFRPFINDPYLFGKIATLHALSDLAANGAQPLNVNLSITAKIAPQKFQLYELKQMMFGVCEVLKKHNMKIIKGHTNEGTESNLTLSVNGISNHHSFKKNNLNEGDILILTKPIGSGILLRALMLGECQGDWCRELIDELLKDNLDINNTLNSFSISAMTDVTGFSLFGHLCEMLTGVNLKADINFNNIKTMNGVDELLQKNISSHLAPKLAEYYSPYLLNEPSFDTRAMFDPQTNGGLLIAIEEKQAILFIKKIKEYGLHSASCIGKIKSQDDSKKKIILL
jgi:selenide, water dikinase